MCKVYIFEYAEFNLLSTCTTFTLFFLLSILKSEMMLFLLIPVYIYSVYSIIIKNLFIIFSFLYLYVEYISLNLYRKKILNLNHNNSVMVF